MDEQVKARLIGATVLVAIAVLLVPAVLSGPKRGSTTPAAAEGKRATRTYTVDLGGAVASGARLQPEPRPAPPARETPRLPTVEAPGVVAEHAGQDVDADVDAAARPEAAAAPAAAVATSEPPAKPTVSAMSSAPSSTTAVVNSARSGWAVQVGAFGSADSARKLVSSLAKDGLPAYVAPLSRNGKTLHRVRVGPQPTRAAADDVAASLKRRGLPAAVVGAD